MENIKTGLMATKLNKNFVYVSKPKLKRYFIFSANHSLKHNAYLSQGNARKKSNSS